MLIIFYERLKFQQVFEVIYSFCIITPLLNRSDYYKSKLNNIMYIKNHKKIRTSVLYKMWSTQGVKSANMALSD